MSHKESKVTSRFDEPTRGNQPVTITKAAVTTKQAAANTNSSHGRVVQNYLLIWVDANIHESNMDSQNTLANLRAVVNDVNIFTTSKQCIQFLNDVDREKAFVIISGTLGQELVPIIHDMPKVDVIYIFCGYKAIYEQWTKQWKKVKGVYTSITPICKALQIAVKQCDQDCIPVSIVTGNIGGSSQDLNQLEPNFMYTQIFKNILLEMEHNQESIKNLATYCRNLYNGNTSELNVIKQFEDEYNGKRSIWWYTRECFAYQILNRALRTLEPDTIIHMGFFIRDLHKRIKKLHKKQFKNYIGKSFIVYRGQGLSEEEFQKFCKTRGGLMSFNNFLSTSTSREISLRFAQDALVKTGMVGILFQMSINPSVSSAPFAAVREFSYFKGEEEILFSMHTIFRIGEITKIHKNKPLYQVNLQLTSDDDQQLQALTKHILPGTGRTGWERIGTLLFHIKKLDKAEEIYKLLLEQTSDEREKVFYCNQLGAVKHDQGDYKKAIWYYERGIEISHRTLPVNQSNLATSYHNIGLAYYSVEDYLKALAFYEKALEIRQKTLPSNHPDLATSYNNIGGVYEKMEKYSEALSFYQEGFEILQQTLPANHPVLATSYNNIAGVYHSKKEDLKALPSYQKALEIRQKTLPPNHPDLAFPYNNIGEVYRTMEEYPKALSFFKKALEIRQKTLSANHPHLAFSYQNVGEVYQTLGKYSKALSSFQKALEIRRKILPANSLDLANTYHDIADVHRNMGEYSKALPFYGKELEIHQKIIPADHSDLAFIYNDIGGMYRNMKEYSKALWFFEKTLEIRQKTLSADHPDLAITYTDIGLLYRKMREYSKALWSLEKAFEILRQTLPTNHPDLAHSYYNIGSVYYSMGEYSKAISSLEKAFEICKKTLPANHPDLAIIYNDIHEVRQKMGEYSKEVSLHQKEPEIRQKTLPSNDPHRSGGDNKNVRPPSLRPAPFRQ